MNLVDKVKIDRTHITQSKLGDPDWEDIAYWRTRTVAERLAHVELLRQINYGSRAAEGLYRVLEHLEIKRG